jgi:hypothetical protein
MGPAEPRPQGQARPRVLAYLARFVFQLRQWLPLLAIVKLQGDWRLRQAPAATEARAHLPRQKRPRDRLRIAAVRLSSTREGARIRLRWFSCWKRSWR